MNGIFSLQFMENTGSRVGGTGVAFLKDGQLHGGDAGFFYLGRLKETGTTMEAEVKVTRHLPGAQSIFGLDQFTLQLNGRRDQTGFVLTGHVRENPKMQIAVKGVKTPTAMPT